MRQGREVLRLKSWLGLHDAEATNGSHCRRCGVVSGELRRTRRTPVPDPPGSKMERDRIGPGTATDRRVLRTAQQAEQGTPALRAAAYHPAAAVSRLLCRWGFRRWGQSRSSKHPVPWHCPVPSWLGSAGSLSRVSAARCCLSSEIPSASAGGTYHRL